MLQPVNNLNNHNKYLRDCNKSHSHRFLESRWDFSRFVIWSVRPPHRALVAGIFGSNSDPRAAFFKHPIPLSFERAERQRQQFRRFEWMMSTNPTSSTLFFARSKRMAESIGSFADVRLQRTT